MLTSQIRPVRAAAITCAPVELAEAEARIDFGIYASERGRLLEARDEINRASSLVSAVLEKSSGSGCEGDRDGDGVVDTLDRCPDIPEDFDNENDEDGCPDFDRDKDGVPDDRDRCPQQAEDKDGLRAIHWAAKAGELGPLEMLLNVEGERAQDITSTGQTLFHVSAGNGHVQVLAVLLRRMAVAAVNAGAHDDFTALHSAAWHGHAAACEILLASDRFTKVNAVVQVEKEYGGTAKYAPLATRYSEEEKPFKKRTPLGEESI